VPVGPDNFSVRWRQQRTYAAGAHTFKATADDGIRVLVDGVNLIDAWRNQSPTSYSATKTLTAGVHTVVVEYYEDGYGAVARLDVTCANCTTSSATALGVDTATPVPASYSTPKPRPRT
jgi:hypothetical protein